MNCNTKVSDCSHKELTKIVNLTIDWCIDNMGYKKKRGLPWIKVSKGKLKKDPCYAWYINDEHTITVFPATFIEYKHTLRKFIGIILHEYCHTLQKGGDKKYLKLSKKYGYWNNPMEVEARSHEKNWNKCYNEIKNLL
jgi:hypothetical protein